MATKTRNGRINFDAAIALMIQNQAALEAQMIASLNLWTETRQKLSDLELKTEEKFAQIQRDLETIRAILIHLPEAVRDKIGFKRQ